MAYVNPRPSLLPTLSAKTEGIKNDKPVDGYKEHKNIYFAFIDVLGFKQTFDENREAPKSTFAQKFETVFNYYHQLLDDAHFMKADFAGAGQTSDSLYFYTERPDHLAEFLKVYLHFSLYSMSQNIFFRGGIAKGSLFVNKPHQFYGDCVIKAYLLEEKISKYPRIAFDQATFSALQKFSDLESALQSEDASGRFYLKPFIHIDNTEIAAITNLDISQILSVKYSDILKFIKKGKDRFEFDANNYPKYQFLSGAAKESQTLFE